MKNRIFNSLRLFRPSAAAAALGALTLLSACSVLPRAEPLDTYLLPSVELARSATQAAAPLALPVSLRVSRPVAGVQLSGQRIVVVPEAHRVSVYKGVSWSEPAPVLLRDRIMDAFRADGRIAALSNDTLRLQADFELASDLQAFHSEYRNGVPEVVLRLDVRLVQLNGRRIVAARQFEARHRPAGVEVPQVVDSFGQVSGTVASDVVDWAMGVIETCKAGVCDQ